MSFKPSGPGDQALERARAAAIGAAATLEDLTSALRREPLDDMTAGAALEIARRLRRQADELCTWVGETALELGAPPRMLDWADPTDSAQGSAAGDL